MLKITAMVRPGHLEKIRSFLQEFSIPDLMVADPNHRRSIVTIPTQGTIKHELMSKPRLYMTFYMNLDESGRVLKKFIARANRGEFGDSKMCLQSMDV